MALPVQASVIAATWTLRRVPSLTPRARNDLTDLLRAVVQAGASVGFLWPLAPERAQAFWDRVDAAVQRGERLLLLAEDPAGRVIGTVQLILDQPDNQPHRADLAKMLVAPDWQRRGLGEALMRAAEDAARDCGKTLLVLDTVTGSAGDRLYSRLGWQRTGEIPGYALWPDGRPCPTTYFHKAIR